MFHGQVEFDGQVEYFMVKWNLGVEEWFNITKSMNITSNINRYEEKMIELFLQMLNRFLTKFNTHSQFKKHTQ